VINILFRTSRFVSQKKSPPIGGLLRDCLKFIRCI
jgi:hypothetical protein